MSTVYADAFLQGMVASTAYILLVLAALRLFRRIEPAFVAVGAAFAVNLAALALLVALGVTFNLWMFLVAYWFFATCFLMAFGAVYKSLSLRILKDLMDRPGRSDDYNELFSRYLVQDSYENRLGVIRDKQLVVLRDGKYGLTPRGLKLARRVRALQIAFGIERSG